MRAARGSKYCVCRNSSSAALLLVGPSAGLLNNPSAQAAHLTNRTRRGVGLKLGIIMIFRGFSPGLFHCTIKSESHCIWPCEVQVGIHSHGRTHVAGCPHPRRRKVWGWRWSCGWPQLLGGWMETFCSRSLSLSLDTHYGGDYFAITEWILAASQEELLFPS